MMVVAPDGRCAAFCLFWLDPVNQVGLFEPVGTHPDFQRQGLGKALLLESLRQMKERGMESAIVLTNEGNTAAIRLYESVGFQATNKMLDFGHVINHHPTHLASLDRSEPLAQTEQRHFPQPGGSLPD